MSPGISRMEWTDDKPRKLGAVTPWLVLLAISLLINYVDRGNLSLAAPLLQIYSFCQILAGPKAAGRWTGFQNGFANLADVVAPALTGFIVNRTGTFQLALAITAAMSLAGGFAWVFGVGPLEQVTWSADTRGLPAAVGTLPGVAEHVRKSS